MQFLPPGVFFKATLPATPDAALLEGADLAVYGTRGPGPWGAPPGRSVSLRGRFGTLSVGGGAALLRFSWHGVNYGVRAIGPGAADGVVEMARSMSEVSGAPGWSSADLVRALGYLARHAPDRALVLWEPTPSFTGPPATFAALLRRWREAPSFRLRVIHAGASRVLAEVTLGRQREAISFQVTDRSPLGEGGWWVQGFRVTRAGS